MEKLFSMDGKISGILSRIADLAILNLLWIIGCIPVITIGVSTTAMYSVTLKMARNEETYIAGSYWKAFKENLKQSTVIWAGILAAGLILYFDFYTIGHAQGMKWMAIPAFMCLIILVLLFTYVFPVLAYFRTGTAKAVKNALLLAVGYLPYTIGILLITALPILILFSNNLVLAMFADVVIGAAASAFFASYLLRRVFDKVRVVRNAGVTE